MSAIRKSALTILVTAVTSAGWQGPPTAARAGKFTGGDPCSLIEGLPPIGHPIRAKGPYRKLFKRLNKAGRSARKMLRVHRSFTSKVARLLAASRRVFHPGKNKRVGASRAQRFLKQYVLGPSPALVIADDRFEPPISAWTAMIWTACRGGRRAEALAHARRAGRTHPSLAAFATLLLLDTGAPGEARELAPQLRERNGELRGFLAPFVAAELAHKGGDRARLAAMARRRISTPDQAEAVRLQGLRHAAGAKGNTRPSGAHPQPPETDGARRR